MPDLATNDTIDTVIYVDKTRLMGLSCLHWTSKSVIDCSVEANDGYELKLVIYNTCNSLCGTKESQMLT